MSPVDDARTVELRDAHDALAPFYATRLADALDRMPVDRAVLDLFCELVTATGADPAVGDIGCGTGRLAPYLARHGVIPTGVDLSPAMVRTARRDHPGFAFRVADLRELPFGDGELAGVVAWYSLMYLPPQDRAPAYRELARVVRPGGQLAMAWKLGDDTVRRAGRATGLDVEFDIWWHSEAEVARLLTGAGFTETFRARRPATPDEPQPQAYLIATR